MPISVSARTENEIAILELEGTLTLGPSLHTLRDAARQVLSQQKISGLIIQVASVTTTDSAGLGELMVVYTYASRQSCPLVLAGVSQNLRNILEVTHLDGLLPSTADVPGARKLIADGARRSDIV